MPAVKKGESESAYVSRCVRYVMEKEGKSQKEALGKCYGMWRSGKSVAKHLGK